MEVNTSFAFSALICTLAFLLLFKTFVRKDRRNRNLPPGPKPWPVIGNLNLVGSLPHQSFHFLSQKYGEIMQLQFGKFPVVVASSPEMAKQFLKVHDTVFASRPALAAGKHTSYDYSDMTWAPYGPYWRQARKIFLSEVFSPKKLESSEKIRVEERNRFIARLHSLSGNNKSPVRLRDQLMRYTVSSISRIVLGQKYFSESSEDGTNSDQGLGVVGIDELRAMSDEWFYLTGVFNIGDWIPWLGFLDLQGYIKEMKALNKKFDGFLECVIDDHLARRDAKRDFVTSKDVVDAMLDLAEDPNLDVKLTRDSIKALAQNLLVGGIDTSVITVEWCIYEILKQPRIIKKAKEELNRVIGRNRWVEEDDLSQLPYVDAIIMETMRLHPLSTLLPPHYAMEDCNVAGFDIAKGTTVLVNAWSIGRNPSVWDAPEEFIPERFVGKKVDMTGSNFALLPFGSGRRRCPGYSLGLRVVRTTLANLLHGFELKLVEGMKPEDISMEEEYGLTTHPKEPLALIMEPTLPSHLY